MLPLAHSAAICIAMADDYGAPTKVVFLRNLRPGTEENDLVTFGSAFGTVIKVLLLQQKNLGTDPRPKHSDSRRHRQCIKGYPRVRAILLCGQEYVRLHACQGRY